MSEPQGVESPGVEQASTPYDDELMASRYGIPDHRSRPLLITIALLAVLFVGWVVWAATEQANQDVRWVTVGYSDVSDSSITINFDVFKPAGTNVVCTVRALDTFSVEVGRADVPIAAQESDAHVTYTLKVTSRPTSVDVTNCQLDTRTNQ